MIAWSGRDHLQRGRALGCPGGQGQPRVDDQSVPVLRKLVQGAAVDEQDGLSACP